MTWRSKNADFTLTARSHCNPLCLCNSYIPLVNIKTMPGPHRTCVSQHTMYIERRCKEPSHVLSFRNKMPWGGAPACPACNKTVYPMEQAIAADRKPFHAGCIRCQMKGCGWVMCEERPGGFINQLSIISNDLTARSLHKYEGYNICEKCHEMIFIQKVRETSRYELWEMGDL